MQHVTCYRHESFPNASFVFIDSEADNSSVTQVLKASRIEADFCQPREVLAGDSGGETAEPCFGRLSRPGVSSLRLRQNNAQRHAPGACSSSGLIFPFATPPSVVVSFARHGGWKSPSFPRKACPELAEGRESTPQIFGNALSTNWIPPAMAGRE